MTSLREQFFAQARVVGGTDDEKIAVGELNKIARTLKRDIAAHIRQKSSGRKVIYGVGDVKIDSDIVKTLDAYKRLHEICADPEVDLEIYQSNFTASGFTCVVICLDRPYANSRDKDILTTPLPAPLPVPAPSVVDSLREKSSAERQAALKEAREAFPEEFDAVANRRDPAALSRPIPAVKPVSIPPQGS